MVQKIGGGRARWALSAVLLASASVGPMMIAPAAHAQEASERSFDISAQPLADALVIFGVQSGLQVTTNGAVLRGIRTNGVKGSLAPVQALSQLLTGTGFVFRINGNVVTLEPAPQASVDGAIQLGSVRVEGRPSQEGLESALGPVDGYVATRTATATKTDTPIMETPQSISVVSRKEMGVRGVRDVGEAVSYSSGVSTGSTGETTLFGGNNIRIRGFGGNGTAGASFNEYLDGLKLQSSDYVASNLDPWLFERVEILKGPASVLFGQTQPGGVVNMVSKRPHDDMVNKIQVGTGNLDEASAAFDIGGELNQTLQFRMLGLVLEGETQQDHSDRKRQLIAPSLRWKNNTTDITLLGHFQHDDINASILSILPRDAVFSNPNGRVPLSFRVGDPGFEFWDRESWSVGYLASHRFNNAITFRQNLRYTHNEQDSNWIYRWFLDADQRTLNRTAFLSSEASDTFTLDTQLEWKFTTGAVEHTLLVGVDYLDFSDSATADSAGFSVTPTIDIFNPIYNQTIPGPTGSPFVWDDEDDKQQTGIYLQDQIKVGALSLLVGGRYDAARTSTKDNLSTTTTKESDHDFTVRLGAIYNFENGLAPYLSYAESFEPVTGRALDGSRFKPMRGKQYEIGIKYHPLGTNHLLTLAAFDLTQENVTTSDPDNVGFSIQTGEVRVRGIEFEGRLSLVRSIDIVAAYTHLQDTVTKSNDGYQGNRRSQIPENTASLWLNYDAPEGPLAGLGLGAGIRYIGETEGDSSNTFSVPSYTLFDFALSYDLGENSTSLDGWKVNFNINNVFNKYYIASCFATHSCYLGQGRVARASLSYSW